MKKIVLILFCMFLWATNLYAYRIREIIWYDSYEDAVQTAQNERKHILLIFTKNKEKLLQGINVAIANDGFIKNYTTKYFVPYIVEIEKEKELTEKFQIKTTPYLVALTQTEFPFYRVSGFLYDDRAFLRLLHRYYSFKKLYYMLNTLKMKTAIFESHKRLNEERVGKLKKWIKKYKTDKSEKGKRKFKKYNSQLLKLKKNIKDIKFDNLEFPLEDLTGTIIKLKNGRYKINDGTDNKTYIFEKNKKIIDSGLRPDTEFRFYFYRLNTFGNSSYIYLEWYE